MRLFAISGSLRKASLNTAVLNAAAVVAPPGIDVVLYAGLSGLPLYNFDFDAERVPESVAELRRQIAAHDGLIIASPEYAHGISGPMKNALDWLVGDIAFPSKPVALWNTSPRAHHAQDHLREVLTTMSATIVARASIALPLLGRTWTAESMAGSPEIAQPIREALQAMAEDSNAATAEPRPA